MSEDKREKPKASSMALILFAVSMVILGGLGLIFITQMEILPGWGWQTMTDVYPADSDMIEGGDINGDGISEVMVYFKMGYMRLPGENIEYNIPNWGGLFLLNGKTGVLIWNRAFDGPVQNVFKINDVNGDNIMDYFISRLIVNMSETEGTPGDGWGAITEHQDHPSPVIRRDLFINQLVSGKNGADINILVGDGVNITTNYVKNVLNLGDYEDNVEDLITLEYIYNPPTGNYNLSIMGYYINGTLKNQKQVAIYQDLNLGETNPNRVPAISLYQYYSETHLLLIRGGGSQLINLTSTNYSAIIYPESALNLESYIIIKDLTSDGNSELIFIDSYAGKISIRNGTDGTELYNFLLPQGKIPNLYMSEIGNTLSGETLLFISHAPPEGSENFNQGKDIYLFSIKGSTHTQLWMQYIDSIVRDPLILDYDISGDGINDILVHERLTPFLSMNEINRFSIIDAMNYDNKLGIINIDQSPEKMIMISDVNGDGKRDFGFTNSGRTFGLALINPRPIFLSPVFPLGIPLFIILLTFLVLGILILIIKGKQLEFSFKKGYRENKLTFIINVVAISLMTISFLLFLIQINIFNSTLVTGYLMSEIITVYLLVSILWYGLLPLTAAIYTIFAPGFAFFFVRLRNIFFKISRSYYNEILILDMGERRELGTVNRIKRVILPLFLSISIGFYIYNFAAPKLGYAQSFALFGSTDFFSFISGYVLLCTLPMLATFLIFSWLIAGNFLLDDAGVVYYLESKKHRKPGDIEPISIWSQSLIKGIAGITAILTFVTFFSNVDFSGFFTMGGNDGGVMFFIFGLFMVIVMFWGTPFLTSFAYILLTVDVMDTCKDSNSQKLYKIMEKHGYDITPRKITNLYPSGFQTSDKMKRKEKPEKPRKEKIPKEKKLKKEKKPKESKKTSAEPEVIKED